MIYASMSNPQLSGANVSRPFLASYDLGHEFSQEHHVAVQCMVEDAEEEQEPATYPQELEEVV